MSDDSDKPVLVDKTIANGNVWVISINRPEARNAINLAASQALVDAFQYDPPAILQALVQCLLTRRSANAMPQRL
jgi:1,4-dihydroxy-2-naphthoyl-CoA synthase